MAHRIASLVRGASPPYGTIWWFVFTYAAAAAAFVQFIGLPYVFSGWHAGNGLLVGMDSVAYHAQAVELAERIRTEGWSVWSPRPEGHFSVGFATAIYALTISQPWVVIPFNAAAHALSTIVLLRILLLFTSNWRWCVLATLPFAFFPSAMIWYTQLLKDGFFFTGALLFVYGWIVLTHRASWEGGWHRATIAVIWIMLGYAIMGLIRPFALSLMVMVAVPLPLILCVSLGMQVKRRSLSFRGAVIAVTVAGICWAALLGIKQYTVSSGIMTEKAIEYVATRASTELLWSKSRENSITPFVVVKLVSLANVRYGYSHADPDARSAVDTDIGFSNSGDVVGYLPRAAQIAFLSPFPEQWFGQGKYESTTFMRKISMFEMLIVYAALAFLPFFLWRYRGSGEAWVLLTICTSIMVIYAMAIPNVGTLYRLRYGFLMPLVGLGILGGLMAWDGLRSRRPIEHLPP